MEEIDKMNKKNLVEKLIINLQERAKETKKSFESAQQAAVAAPGAMQSKSDTTKFQMSRLAENSLNAYQQIQRCISVLKEIDSSKDYQIIEVGAIVKVEEGQSEDCYFVLPSDCGNQTVEVEGEEVVAIASKSPIAQALLNKKIGDEVDVKVPTGLRSLRIIDIE